MEYDPAQSGRRHMVTNLDSHLLSQPNCDYPMASCVRYVHPSLEIPEDIESQILPDQRISVLDFLKYPFPFTSTFSPNSPSAESLLSKEEPDLLCSDQLNDLVRKTPIPPVATVTVLGKFCKGGLQGFKSVVCRHAQAARVEHLPLWLITYWTEVVELHVKWKGPWVRAERVLQERRRQLKDGVPGTLVDDIFSALSTMPWRGHIAGFTSLEPVSTLATYVTQDWFSDVHVNQCLDLLRRALMLDPTKSKVEIENLAFIHKLREAHQIHDTELYMQSHTFSHIRALGQAGVTGQRDELGVIFNIRDSHWVSAVIDFRRGRILYADPLGDPPDTESMDVFDWWTYHHTGLTFAHETLTTTHQTDRFSCRLLSWNALAHYFDRMAYPLIHVA
jgi:hypothetical protein